MADSPVAHIQIKLRLSGASFSARGSVADVFDALDRFEQLLVSTPPRPTVASATDNDTDTADAVGAHAGDLHNRPEEKVETKGEADAAGKMPLKPFLRQRKLPRGNAGLAFGVAVWATRFDGANDISLEDFRGYWGKAGERWPANPVRDLRRAVQDGWLDESSEHVFRLSDYGQSEFDDLEAAPVK